MGAEPSIHSVGSGDLPPRRHEINRIQDLAGNGVGEAVRGDQRAVNARLALPGEAEQVLDMAM